VPRNERSIRACVFLCLRRANPIRGEGSPFWETLAFSYPRRCEPMPLEPRDDLSNLVPFRPFSRGLRSKLGQSRLISVGLLTGFKTHRMASSASVGAAGPAYSARVPSAFHSPGTQAAMDRCSGISGMDGRKSSPPLVWTDHFESALEWGTRGSRNCKGCAFCLGGS
jgi:hypothetical protein